MYEKSNVCRIVWLKLIHKLDYVPRMYNTNKSRKSNDYKTPLVGFTWNAKVDKIWRGEGKRAQRAIMGGSVWSSPSEAQSERKAWNSALWKEWFRQIPPLLTSLYGKQQSGHDSP